MYLPTEDQNPFVYLGGTGNDATGVLQTSSNFIEKKQLENAKVLVKLFEKDKKFYAKKVSRAKDQQYIAKLIESNNDKINRIKELVSLNKKTAKLKNCPNNDNFVDLINEKVDYLNKIDSIAKNVDDLSDKKAENALRIKKLKEKIISLNSQIPPVDNINKKINTKYEKLKLDLQNKDRALELLHKNFDHKEKELKSMLRYQLKIKNSLLESLNEEKLPDIHKHSPMRYRTPPKLEKSMLRSPKNYCKSYKSPKKYVKSPNSPQKNINFSKSPKKLMNSPMPSKIKKFPILASEESSSPSHSPAKRKYFSPQTMKRNLLFNHIFN